MSRHVYIPIGISVLAIVIFSLVAQIMGVVWIFIPATIITLLVYFKSFYRHMPEPSRILPLYLFALGVQMLHFAEEFLYGFVADMPALFGEQPYPVDSWLFFNMAAYFIFIVGGIALFRKNKEYAIIPLFFIVVGVVLNGIGHVGLSIYNGGYFPGLFTAVVYLFIGPVLIKRIFSTNEKNLLA